MKLRGDPGSGYRALSRSALSVLITIAALGAPHGVRADTGSVDGARIENADAEARNWLSYGRTYSEQRYSPLKQINAENVKGLGLLWSYDLEAVRGVEATPVVIDGIMYVTAPWSIVHAVHSCRLLAGSLDAPLGWLKR